MKKSITIKERSLVGYRIYSEKMIFICEFFKNTQNNQTFNFRINKFWNQPFSGTSELKSTSSSPISSYSSSSSASSRLGRSSDDFSLSESIWLSSVSSSFEISSVKSVDYRWFQNLLQKKQGGSRIVFGGINFESFLSWTVFPLIIDFINGIKFFSDFSHLMKNRNPLHLLEKIDCHYHKCIRR